MNEKINEKVKVIALFDGYNRTVMPYYLKWQGKIHRITTIGYHHTQREGRTLIHIFSVSNDVLAFRLSFNTDNLLWTLEEVSDGTTN